MTKDTETPKKDATGSDINQSGGQAFVNGLNERLRTLVGIQQAHADGHIQLTPETSQGIEAEIARIKRTTEKMERHIAKIDLKQPKNSSQVPSQNGGRN